MRGTDPIPFLGCGWKYPVQFSQWPHQAVMVKGEEDIRESLWILLSTTPGERVMRPGYGCRLQRFMFQDLTTSLITEIADEVATAILRWESRIDVIAISVNPDPDPDQFSLVHIHVEYAIRRTNERSNLVFPFYLTEATLATGP